jgi:ubiquinone/menaquinone biosynthesis C-methylase UbiE
MSHGARDPTIYRGAAAHYLRGRAPYSRELAATLARELGLDGSGRLLDVGCGPGVLALDLAGLFGEVVGLDQDAEMLGEGERRAAREGIGNVRWVRAWAEELPGLALGSFRLVTFGQSFHWMRREEVAEVVYDLLEPGGAVALMAHDRPGRPEPAGPGHPPVPREAIRALLDRYLGPRRRAGQGFSAPPADRYEVALARTRFGAPRVVHCPGRADIVQDLDGVVAGVFSNSYAAPHLFGERLGEFEAELRAELARGSPGGLYWDWPGDTAIVLARKR